MPSHGGSASLSTLFTLHTFTPMTVMQIWSLDQDTCVHTLSEHSKEIFQLKWCPKPDAIVKTEASKGQIFGFLATSVTSHWPQMNPSPFHLNYLH